MKVIKGLTHDKDGHPVLSRTVTVKVAIGRPPTKGANFPQRLDHFEFLKKVKNAAGIEWSVDTELSQALGENCREFWVIFLDDDPEQVFKTNYEAFVKRGCWCRGDGIKAQRRGRSAPAQGGEWPEMKVWEGPCAEGGCPEIEAGTCGPSGDLYFMLAMRPTLGTICRWHTGSYRMIREIHSSLHDIMRITGGRLVGVRAKLFMRPEKINYQDKGQLKTTNMYIVGLELSAKDLAELEGKMLEAAKSFQKIQLQLGGGKVEINEPDEERGEELTTEFYPAVAAADKPTILAPENPEVQQRTRARELMRAAGLTDAMIEQRLQKFAGRLPELIKNAEAFLAQRNPGGESCPANGSSSQAVGQPTSTTLRAPDAPADSVGSAPQPASAMPQRATARPATPPVATVAQPTPAPTETFVRPAPPPAEAISIPSHSGKSCFIHDGQPAENCPACAAEFTEGQQRKAQPQPKPQQQRLEITDDDLPANLGGAAEKPASKPATGSARRRPGSFDF